jgi:glucosamine kinase
VQALVREGLDNFLKTHVCCFPNHKEVSVNFVGSIAYYYEDILRAAAAPLGIHIGKVVKQPIKGIMDYHLKYSLSKVV